MRTRSLRPSPHVGQEERLRAVREEKPHALFVGRRSGPLRGREPPHAQRRVPGEDLVLGHEGIGKAVAREIDEAQIGVAPVDVRQRQEGNVLRPPSSCIAFMEAWRGRLELHDIDRAVAVEVQQVLPALRQGATGGQGRHIARGRKAAGAEVRGVAPCAGFLTEDTRQTLAVQVDPKIAGPLQSNRKADHTILRQRADLGVDFGAAVAELQRRHRLPCR